MTPITAPTSLDSPDADGALPGKAPRQTPPPGAFPTGGATGSDECHATVPGGTEAGRGGDGGNVVRSGKPRNDPNLAPAEPARGLDLRGARARTTGLGCRAPAMANGRCRMHGGRSTGPRTPEGLARLAAAHTKHGNDGAAWRAVNRYQRTVIVRSRLLAGAYGLGPHLPPDIAARMALGANELAPPPHYSRGPVVLPETGALGHDPVAERGSLGRDARGRFVARARPALRGRMVEREAARSEAAMLAPWRAGIAWARAAERAVLAAARGQNAMLSQPPGARPGGETVRSDAAAARMGSVPGQGARSADLGRHPIQRETVRPDAVAAGVGSVPGQGARSVELGRHPIQRETVRSGGAAARMGSVPGQGPRSAELGRHRIQRETVRSDAAAAGVGSVPGQGARSADLGQRSMLSLPPGACPGGEKATRPTGAMTRTPPAARTPSAVLPLPPTLVSFAAQALKGRGSFGFRTTLLSSTVCNEPAAGKLAVQIRRGRGWPVRTTMDEAERAELVRQAWVAEVGRRMAEEAKRLRTRCVLRVGSVADIVRRDDLASGGQ